MSGFDVLIVGAGHGGAQAAIALRQRGHSGSIGIVTDDVELPYDRPPLSKDYLSGAKDFERILARPPAFWGEKKIAVCTGVRVAAVDPNRRIVQSTAGATIKFGDLIWAAGGQARKMSCGGHDFAGVHSVRTRADVDKLKAELPTTSHIVVIGGGYIGLEAAAILVKAGKKISIVEAMPRVLARVAGEPLSRFFESEHRSNGVDLRLGETVFELEGDDKGVTGVRLASGELLAADLVIVGIGIAPAVDALAAAGAECGNGVQVDEFCRTSLAHVFAIGDCALHRNRFAGNRLVRLESVQNATDQANVVAQYLTGSPVPYEAVPWFWSNQYDLKLQTVGLSTNYDELVIRGEPQSKCFSLIYLSAGEVIAVDSVNCVKDFVQAKALVSSKARLRREILADVSISFKQALQANEPQGSEN